MVCRVKKSSYVKWNKVIGEVNIFKRKFKRRCSPGNLKLWKPYQDLFSVALISCIDERKVSSVNKLFQVPLRSVLDPDFISHASKNP